MGVGFYIKNGLKFQQWTDLDLSVIDENNEFKSCWAEIINNLNPNILMGCYYRHPRKTSDDVFLEKLGQSINKIKRSDKYIIVCGYLNYNLLHHELNQYVNEFVNMYSNFLHPCITEPTRLIKKQRPSLIDNISVNFCNKIIISDKISDHLPCFVVIKDINNKQRENSK